MRLHFFNWVVNFVSLLNSDTVIGLIDIYLNRFEQHNIDHVLWC